MRPEYVLMENAAERMNVTRRTIRNWVAAGLPVTTIGGVEMVRLSDLRAIAATMRKRMHHKEDE